MKIFTHPGLFSSGPQHWQTHWEKDYGYERIEQSNWETPVCNDWLAKLDTVVAQHPPEEVIIAAHSLATSTIVRWAEKYKRIIKGALLVAPSDVEAPSYPPGTTGFSPMPNFKLPFPSIVIASTDDEYVSMERAKKFADDWGSELVNIGAVGHINSSSNLGKWTVGHMYLKKLMI